MSSAADPTASTADPQAAAIAAMLAALPPLDRMALISIWIETLIYGVNLVVFFGALYVLLFKQRRGNNVQSYLLGASLILFSISTAHVAISLRQLIEALTDKKITSVPGGSVLYFLTQTDPLVFGSQVLYALNVLVQDLVLIWRLYAVWGSNWKIAILPLLMEAAHTAIAIFTVSEYFHGASLEDQTIRHWGLASWSLDLIINIGVTFLIAAKIWYAGRGTVSARGHNAYLGVALTILESGGLFTGATLILFILYINTTTGLDALVGVNVVIQLATLSPLLIVARVGLGLTHGNLSSHVSHHAGTTQVSTARFGTESNALRVDIHRTAVSDYEAGKDSFAMRPVKGDL